MNASDDSTPTVERGPRARGLWAFSGTRLSPLFTRRGSARYTYR